MHIRYIMSENEIEENTKELIVDTLDTAIAPFTLGIPIMSLVDNFIKIGKNFYDKRTLAKLLAFLEDAGYTKANDKDKDKIDKFFEKRISNDKYAQTNGELLLDYLCKSEDIRKTALIGRVFSLLIKDDTIDSDSSVKDKFFRTAYYINNSYYDDLFALKLFANSHELLSSQDNRLDKLNSYGFLNDNGIDAGGASDEEPGGKIYSINEYGNIVLAALE